MLYKYLPHSRISYIGDGLLRSTQPAALNDPFECISSPPTIKEAIDLCKRSHNDFIVNGVKNASQLERLSNVQTDEILRYEISKISDNQHPNYLDYLIQNQIERINALFGIISFSKRWDSSLMWSHYCESHLGFCIGFDSDHPFFFTDESSFFKGSKVTVAVEYSNRRIKIPIDSQNVSFFKNSWRLLALKSKDWKYEDEVRTITLLSDAAKVVECSPYNMYLFFMPHEAIKEIIIGINTPRDINNTITNFAHENGIKLYQAKASDKKFTLDRYIVQ